MQTQNGTGVQTAPIVDTIERDLPAHSNGRDPMEIRWGINTVVREKLLEGHRTGFGILPYAQFFAVKRFSTPEEVHSTDETMERERRVTRTALSVEMVLNEMLAAKDAMGNPAVGQPDWGFRTDFYGEMDAAKMLVISKTLLPSLPEIRRIAESFDMPSPIGSKCDGQDNMDVGERQSCPTCWSQWIDSDVCSKHIEATTLNGVPVRERNAQTQEIEDRIVRPSVLEFTTAREAVRLSLQIGLAALAQEWMTISTELERGERKDANFYQHGMRKDLHEGKPQDRQISLMREFGKASGGGGNGEMAPVLTMLAQSQAQMAQSQAQTNQILAAIAQQQGIAVPQQQVPPPAATAPVVVEATTDEPIIADPVPTEETTSGLSPAALAMSKGKNKDK